MKLKRVGAIPDLGHVNAHEHICPPQTPTATDHIILAFIPDQSNRKGMWQTLFQFSTTANPNDFPSQFLL